MRYLPLNNNDRKAMLDVVGVSNVDALFEDVPKSARLDGLIDLPKHQTEAAVERYMARLSNKSVSASSVPFFCGAGAYKHHIPASVDHLIQRSEFLTAYTPYQPEIAQGTLQMVFEFQTFIAQLTGQEVANASMYDGATAAAEAALMAMRINKKYKVVLGNELHPDYRATLQSYMGNIESGVLTDGDPDDETACVIVQSPDFFGKPEKYEAWRKKCDETGALLIVVINEIVSLGLLPPPVEADIVCGEAQSIGLPMSFGGPHLGFFTCREKFVRQMPGRLCGVTEDADGKRGFVLTLNTREQHIRREKATSNICTNSGLCCLAFTIHMSLLGEAGLKRMAALNHEKACDLADRLSAIKGVELINDTFFNEFTIRLPKDAGDVVQALADKGVLGGVPVSRLTDGLHKDLLLVCATETASDEDIAAFETALKEVLS